MVATQAKGQDVLPAGFDVIFNLSQEGYGVFVLVLCLNKLCNRLDILLAATVIHGFIPASRSPSILEIGLIPASLLLRSCPRIIDEEFLPTYLAGFSCLHNCPKLKYFPFN